jgi:hypothetical protein
VYQSSVDRFSLFTRPVIGSLPYYKVKKFSCQTCLATSPASMVAGYTALRVAEPHCYSVINLAKLIQRQLATSEWHGDPATCRGAAEIEVPEGYRGGPVSGQAYGEQLPA